MRDKNLTFIQFVEEVERYYQFGKETTSINFLTEAVFISPTRLREGDWNFVFPNLKLNNLRSLTLMSYHLLDENEGWLIRGQIMDLTKHFSLKDQLRINPMLINLKCALVLLYESDEFSSHDFFGNFIKLGVKFFDKMDFKKKYYKLVPTIRRRGYKDKGSRRSYDKWLPTYDWSLNQLHYEIQVRKLSFKLISILQEEYFLRKFSFYFEENSDKLKDLGF